MSKMVYPSLKMASKDQGMSIESWLFYYCVSLFIASANFTPLLSDSSLTKDRLPYSTCYVLTICYLLSLPLLFEFALDIFVATVSSAAEKTKEPRFGYFIILLSLFLPILSVNIGFKDASSPYSVLFINCFVSFLQAMVVIAQYDKLQFRTKGHWKIQGSLTCIFFFVASQVCMNFGVAYSPIDMDHKTPQMKSHISISLASGVICYCLHLYHCKRYLLTFFLQQYRKTPAAKAWTVDDFVAVVLQCISSTYFLINCIFCIVFLSSRYNTVHHANSSVIIHIVLGLTVAILPGRVIRKNFMLLNERMAIKETFIRYVSHEIRSPLSTTSLGLNCLLNQLHSGVIKPSEMLNVVQESLVTCELAMNTLNDFLMLDKIQSNMLEISPVTCQASEFMVEAIQPFTLQASSVDVSLSCNVESFDGVNGREVSVDIDSYKMNQVLRNLLSNAFKFTPTGGSVTVAMTIHEYSPEDLVKAEFLNSHTIKHCEDGWCSTVRFSVKDSGCGISAENLPKLFGQYVQFDAAKLQGGKGSGLGLWLSKAIVEMHGGKIGAKSKGDGKGCTFWFELPCEVSEADRAARRSSRCNSFVSRTFARSRSVSLSMGDRRKSTVETCNTDDCVVVDLEKNLQDFDIESGGGGIGVSNVMDLPADVKIVPRPPGTHSIARKAMMPHHLSKMFVDLELEIPSSMKAAAKYKQSPKLKQSPKKATTPIASSCDVSSVDNRERLQVLLVDDCNISRKMVERSLASIDAVCCHARNGLEAVEKVKQSLQGDIEQDCGFDVILMDHHMPEMNGPEAVIAIRALGFKGVIMGVSGNASTDTEFDGQLVSGKINKVMMKPFNLSVFVDFMSRGGCSSSSSSK